MSPDKFNAIAMVNIEFKVDDNGIVGVHLTSDVPEDLEGTEASETLYNIQYSVLNDFINNYKGMLVTGRLFRNGMQCISGRSHDDDDDDDRGKKKPKKPNSPNEGDVKDLMKQVKELEKLIKEK